MPLQQNKKQLVAVDQQNILDAVKDEIFNTFNCVKIGKIVSFNPEDQTASIKISFKIIIQEDEKFSSNGQQTTVQKLIDYPVLIKCPCFMLFGGNSYITMPIQEGDNCIVLFCDRDIDNWFTNGEGLSLNTLRMHDINDGIAIVGIHNTKNAIKDFLSNAIRIKYDDDNYINLLQDLLTIVFTVINITGDINITGNQVNTGSISAASVSATGNVAGGTVTAGNGITGNYNPPFTIASGIVTGGTPV